MTTSLGRALAIGVACSLSLLACQKGSDEQTDAHEDTQAKLAGLQAEPDPYAADQDGMSLTTVKRDWHEVQILAVGGLPSNCAIWDLKINSLNEKLKGGILLDAKEGDNLVQRADGSVDAHWVQKGDIDGAAIYAKDGAQLNVTGTITNCIGKAKTNVNQTIVVKQGTVIKVLSISSYLFPLTNLVFNTYVAIPDPTGGEGSDSGAGSGTGTGAGAPTGGTDAGSTDAGGTDGAADAVGGIDAGNMDAGGADGAADAA